MKSVSLVILEICQGLVSKPDSVKVREELVGDVQKILISVDKEDMGVVIGKGGRIIKALRRLSAVLGVKNRKKIIVELEEHAD